MQVDRKAVGAPAFQRVGDPGREPFQPQGEYRLGEAQMVQKIQGVPDVRRVHQEIDVPSEAPVQPSVKAFPQVKPFQQPIPDSGLAKSLVDSGQFPEEFGIPLLLPPPLVFDQIPRGTRKQGLQLLNGCKSSCPGTPPAGRRSVLR